MTEQEFQKYNSGYNEGFFFAAQALASRILRLIDNHPSWMLEPDKRQAKAEIKLVTKYLLQKRRIIPTSYDVITGKAENVEINFNTQY